MVTTGSSLSGDCVCLFGVKGDVPALNADHIILGLNVGVLKQFFGHCHA